jgi:hypothetical protein
MFAATAVLARATWKYMKSTKKMADSMDIQANIMQREFEIRISPLINIIQQHSETGTDKGTYQYIIENLGAMPVKLFKAHISIWHPENSSLEFPTIPKRYDLDIAPKGHREIIIELVFAEINKVLLDNQMKKEVMMQPVFRIYDAKHELRTFQGPKRTIWE